MKLKIIQTTDGKYLDQIFDVDDVTVESCIANGITPTHITWFGDICTVRDANFTIKLKKIED